MSSVEPDHSFSITLSSDYIQVIDNVLSAKELQLLQDYIKIADYQPAMSGKWMKVFRYFDGNPLQGDVRTSTSLSDEECARHPLDPLIRIISDHAHRAEYLVGRVGADWSHFVARATLYPAGSALAWHTDRPYSGAFTYFAHPEWNSYWGGELLVFPQIIDPQCLGARNDDFFPSAVPEHILSECGIGTFVQPKSNRLVFIRNGVPHAIRRVESAAGNFFRSAVSGFFMRPQLVREKSCGN